MTRAAYNPWQRNSAVMTLHKIQSEANNLYNKANHFTHGTLEIWRQALIRFGRVQGLEAAASIAYFAIFSLFPLLLLLISVAGFLMRGEEAIELVLGFVSQIAPTNPEGLEEVLRQVVAVRDISGLIGAAGLLLAASGVFTTLARNINRAWPDARRHGLVRSQLMAFGLIAILITMMFLWVVWGSFITLLLARGFPILERYISFQAGSVMNRLLRIFPWITSFILFIIIYRWLPNTNVRWSEAFWGALFASTGWSLVTSGFNWFLHSGMANYDILYGSLGTSISLLTWVFISSIIILFGAHLSASIARATRLKNITEVEGQSP